MITLICLWYMALAVNAPTWIFWLIGINAFISVLNFGMTMYKKGSDSK